MFTAHYNLQLLISHNPPSLAFQVTVTTETTFPQAGLCMTVEVMCSPGSHTSRSMKLGIGIISDRIQIDERMVCRTQDLLVFGHEDDGDRLDFRTKLMGPDTDNAEIRRQRSLREVSDSMEELEPAARTGKQSTLVPYERLQPCLDEVRCRSYHCGLKDRAPGAALVPAHEADGHVMNGANMLCEGAGTCVYHANFTSLGRASSGQCALGQQMSEEAERGQGSVHIRPPGLLAP
ncbi:hypothetical protein AAY473_016632, partial [Plecturocebus cupreus]